MVEKKGGLQPASRAVKASNAGAWPNAVLFYHELAFPGHGGGYMKDQM